MFEHFFCYPARIKKLRDGPGGQILEEFAKELHQGGYAKTTAQRHIRAVEHLIYWLSHENMPISSLSEKFLNRYDCHLNGCQCPRFSHSSRKEILSSLRLFLKHLQGIGVIDASINEPSTQDPVLLVDFYQWMYQQRGTSDYTLYNYSHSIRDLINRFGHDPAKYNARILRQFVLEKSQQCGWAAAKTCTTALRMFLRFLIANGKCAATLNGAIPVLAYWRLSSLPRYLQPEEVERIISSCNLISPVGKRDRAILLLLSRLGFRAGDIVQLRLDDIDWEGATIQVSGKSRRQVRLPLTQEIGDAIADYLLYGRPRTDAYELFIRSRAPFRAFASHCAVSVLVTYAMRRAGVTCKSRGAAHVLRHSAATSMLRQGTSLQDIAVILRHHSIETTQIYAKVDVNALQKIAQPWPEVQSC
jgi:integrase/recombinase XerD